MSDWYSEASYGGGIYDEDEFLSIYEDTFLTGNLIDIEESGWYELISFSVDIDGDGREEFFTFTDDQPEIITTIDGIGTLKIKRDGSYTFTPVENYTGQVPAVNYTLIDWYTYSTDTSTLTINVEPVNDAPVDENELVSTNEDTVLTGNVLDNATDVEGDTLSVAQFVIGGTTYTAGQMASFSQGSLIIQTDGSYTFTPVENYNGAVPVATYTVSDGTLTDTSTLTLSILAVNDDPMDEDELVSTNENTVLTGNVLDNTTDVEGDTLSVAQFVIGGTTYTAGQMASLSQGSLIIQTDGSYTFTPAENYNGDVPIVNYTVVDGNGGTDISTLTLTVEPINNASVPAISCETITTIGGIDLGGLTDYLFFFADGSKDANWQGATKGFAGNVAVNGLTAKERTSGGVPYAGTIYTNDSSLGAWQNIVNQNSGQAKAVTGEIDRIDGLKSDLNSAFAQINDLTVTKGFENRSSTSLDGLNTQNGKAETFVINVTSGFNVSSKINIMGDAGDVFVLRWDTDANFSDGYEGQVKFQSGGAIVPLGGLQVSNFIHVAGDINASGGGSNPNSPFPQGPRLDDGTGSLIDGGSDFNGGGFFTGYWLTTGNPDKNYESSSLSNAIFVGGWYTTATKFSMTSGTSGVHVSPNCATKLQSPTESQVQAEPQSQIEPQVPTEPQVQAEPQISSLGFALGEAATYGILVLNDGTLTLNSASVFTGDIGYSKGVVSTTNQKIGEGYFGEWTGEAYVHSQVDDFQYTSKNYRPNGGIITNAAEDARLDAANIAATEASDYITGLKATHIVGDINDTSLFLGEVDGKQTTNVVQLSSLKMNSDVLELKGDANDYFLINVAGDFKFAQSEVRLTGGITADRVIFNFPNASTIELNKSENIFNGTILAPNLTTDLIYHNPAEFNGAIIANHINVHSDFNLNHVGFNA